MCLPRRSLQFTFQNQRPLLFTRGKVEEKCSKTDFYKGTCFRNKEIHVIEDYNCDARKQSGKNTKQQSFDFRLTSVREYRVYLPSTPPTFRWGPLIQAEHINKFLGKINIFKIIFSYQKKRSPLNSFPTAPALVARDRVCPVAF